MGDSLGKESTCNAGDAGDIGSFSGLGRSPEGGHGNSLENPMDRGAWQATIHKVSESDTTKGTYARMHFQQMFLGKQF